MKPNMRQICTVPHKKQCLELKLDLDSSHVWMQVKSSLVGECLHEISRQENTLERGIKRI